MKHPHLTNCCASMEHSLYKSLHVQSKNNLCPKIVGNIFHNQDIPYNLKNEKVCESGNLRTVMYGTETITYRGPEIWKHVPQAIKEITSLVKFKTQVKSWNPTGCTCRLCKTFVPHLGFL